MTLSDAQPVVCVAHVFPRTFDDSMGAFLLHLAQGLVDRGVPVQVVAPHAPGLAAEERLGPVRVHRFRYAPERWERLAYTGTMHERVNRGLFDKVLFAFFLLAFCVRTIRVARSARARLIHAHWWLPGGLVGAAAALVTGTPLLVTTHGTDVELLRRTRWAARLARLVFSRARAVTCGSTYLRNQLLELGVAAGERVSVCPMPVNPLFEGLGSVPREPDLVLTVARLTSQKGIDTLIDAVELLRGRNVCVRLCVVGDGPERAALEQQVRRLQLEQVVEFVGALAQKELPRYYGACSVFVLPSLREGMGLVLAEALLAGAPVVALASGGVTDIVQDGETGLLVPTPDAAALADAIEKLLADPALAARLAANGRAWVRERYTLPRVAEQFVRVYAEATAR